MVRRRTPTKRTDAGKSGESRLPSPDPATNLMIADVVLRGANLLLRKRLEKGLLTGQIGSDNAKRLVENRGVMSTVALWGASRLATRSPVGLAVVAGGLAAKVLYDRGKRVQAKRRTRKTAGTTPDAES
ncbi:hypothetical protein [Erythrobacter sp.]|uniref:hypothetical protein n=1 Tax=Erythrobacter sp. TaxID=1042 RepID=UPI0025CCFB3A|nr:hypothetical protein [Erythrobacter sp.]